MKTQKRDRRPMSLNARSYEMMQPLIQKSIQKNIISRLVFYKTFGIFHLTFYFVALTHHIKYLNCVTLFFQPHWIMMFVIC